MVSTKQQIKDLVAKNKALADAIAAQGKKIDDLTPVDFNALAKAAGFTGVEYEDNPPPPDHTCPAGQHWDDAQGKCIDDTVTPPPPPPPEGDLLYDSNRDIDWNSITDASKKYTIYGTFKPNGKYIRAKASGSPRFYLDPVTKEIILEHDGKYGRLYIGACNYASRLEADVKLESCSHNASFKTRNRHQFADVQSGAPDNQRQGGQGSAFHCDSCDADLEVVHGTEIGGPSAKYPSLQPNKYFSVKFSQFDEKNVLGETKWIHIIDEIDRNDGNGFKVVNEGKIAAPSQFFNKAEFESWSEFWVRLNADSGGKLYIKNLKLYRL